MTRNHGTILVPDLHPLPRPNPGIVTIDAERNVVRTAMRWWDTMLTGGGDLDRVTLEFVYGRRTGAAALDLMDACHDVEHRHGA